jgi:hypothetical protein
VHASSVCKISEKDAANIMEGEKIVVRFVFAYLVDDTKQRRPPKLDVLGEASRAICG